MARNSFHIGVDVDIVEKKIKSLLAQYRRERRKVAGLLIKSSHFCTESTSQ
jgi:hypothetical protein